MYLKRARIENVRSVVEYEINFDNPAGWHVLIGDNGAGKSTIIRALALSLVGNVQAQGLRAAWYNWVHTDASGACIRLDLTTEASIDSLTSKDGEKQIERRDGELLSIETLINPSETISIKESYRFGDEKTSTDSSLFSGRRGLFSAAYGPYRRFKGGALEWNDIFKLPSYAELAAHLSVFDESVALTEATAWLQSLNYKQLENDAPSQHTLENVTKLVNSDGFLPHGAKLESVSSEGVMFRDGNRQMVSVNQMSDGYRSILSMTFELIRQLVRVYGADEVFRNISNENMFIDLPGVVLIDEIDAHLHPTWQTRIGQWFTEYFRGIQFIVTTHSPLVCRAAENGSIWRLAAPGTEGISGQITGPDKDRLIFGNVLDAYGTEIFGAGVSISENSVEKQEDLVKLSKRKMLDDLSPDESKKLDELKKVFTTDASIEL